MAIETEKPTVCEDKQERRGRKLLPGEARGPIRSWSLL